MRSNFELSQIIEFELSYTPRVTWWWNLLFVIVEIGLLTWVVFNTNSPLENAILLIFDILLYHIVFMIETIFYSNVYENA